MALSRLHTSTRAHQSPPVFTACKILTRFLIMIPCEIKSNVENIVSHNVIKKVRESAYICPHYLDPHQK